MKKKSFIEYILSKLWLKINVINWLPLCKTGRALGSQITLLYLKKNNALKFWLKQKFQLLSWNFSNQENHTHNNYYYYHYYNYNNYCCNKKTNQGGNKANQVTKDTMTLYRITNCLSKNRPNEFIIASSQCTQNNLVIDSQQCFAFTYLVSLNTRLYYAFCSGASH